MTAQLEFRFGGVTFDPALDGERLTVQLKKVMALMLDGQWRTLSDISAIVGAPEASVSARLRDLRKPKFGGYEVERKRLDRGLHMYRVSEGA